MLRKYVSTVALVTALLLPGCDFAKNQLASDRSGGMEMQDYKDAMAPRLPDIEEEKDSKKDLAAIPALQPYVASGSDVASSMPLVSIAVNQSVPLRDVLFELAQQADYDIELDPRIHGAIIFTARERPFDQVIERISDIAGLRYKFEGNTLRVELDTPFNKTYKIDYLSLIRSNSSNISNDISVVSGGGTDSGSSYQSSFESESNFWAELETNIQQILATQAGASNLMTTSDPQITAVEQTATNVVPVAPPQAAGSNIQVSPPNAVLRVESLPTGSDAAAPAATPATYAINRQAGLVQVFASEKIQKQIDDYLKLVRRAVTAQVLIEAKILEVSLSDQYATGIDWRAIDLLSGDLTLNYLTTAGQTAFNSFDSSGVSLPTTFNNAPSLGIEGAAIGTSGLAVGYTGNDFQAIVQAVSGFGAVKALASPRLTVLNNQSAVLNVATNRVFFEIDIESSATDGGGTEVDIDSELRNVPEGILVNVQPSIDLDKGVISMALRPTITRVTGTVDDPGVAFAAARSTPPIEGISSAIPELNVQEIDSIIQVKSGQAIVMGGLLQDRVANSEDGIPGLMEVPLVGNLFKQKVDSIQKTELVILLKATILENPTDSVHNTDRDLYRQFSGDRRPFKL